MMDTPFLASIEELRAQQMCPASLLYDSSPAHCCPLTCSRSIYMCNFAVSTNECLLQGPDTKTPRNATECNDYNASNEITRVKLGGAHDLT